MDHKGAESAPVRCLPDQTGEFTQRAAELFAAVLWNVMRVKRSCQPFPGSRACLMRALTRNQRSVPVSPMSASSQPCHFFLFN